MWAGFWMRGGWTRWQSRSRSVARRFVSSLAFRSKAGTQEDRDAQISVAFRSVNLIAQNGMTGNLEGAKRVFAEYQLSLKGLSVGFDPQIVEGEIYSCLNHPDVAGVTKGQACEKCQRPMVARRIPYSFVFVEQNTPVARLIATAEAPPQRGVESNVLLQLSGTAGGPLAHGDLITVHTQPVHALILGPQLEDFQWKQPQPTAKPGEYTLAFTPQKSGPYRVWAAVVPAASGLQEYPHADLGAVEKAVIEPTATTSSSVVGDLRFQLLPVSGRTVVFKARQLQLIRVARVRGGRAARADVGAVYECLCPPHRCSMQTGSRSCSFTRRVVTYWERRRAAGLT
jgi:hypothetical protein